MVPGGRLNIDWKTVYKVYSMSVALLCQEWNQNKYIMKCSSWVTWLGKKRWENPYASCGAHPYVHFLSDFSLFFLSVLFSLISLFHSVFMHSVRAIVLHAHMCTLSLHFHREMKRPQICTQWFPPGGYLLLTFRSLNSQRQNNPPRVSWLSANLSSSSVREQSQESAVTKSSPCLQWAVPMKCSVV